MKIFLCILLILMIAVSAGAESFCVVQSGDTWPGTACSDNDCSGEYAADDCMLVSQFNTGSNWHASNANKIGPGDTVYFYDTITTTIDILGSGTSGNVITLDGYEGGDCDAINNNCANGALINVSGFGIDGRGGWDYITIQDFRITNGPSNGGNIQFNWPSTEGTSDYITIQRIYSYDVNLRHLDFSRPCGNPPTCNSHCSDEPVCAEENRVFSNYITMQDCHFKDHCVTTAANESVRFFAVKDLVVQRNKVLSTQRNTCTSSLHFSFNCDKNLLFQYNHVYASPDQASVSIKEPAPGTDNAIIRFNKIEQGGEWDPTDPATPPVGRSLSIGHSHYVYVYGNYLNDNNDMALTIGNISDNVYIWSNILHDAQQRCIYWETDDGSSNNIHISNNTLYDCALYYTGTSDYTHTGMHFGDNGGTFGEFKNNIVVNHRKNASTYHAMTSASDMLGDITSDYNTYDHTSTITNLWHYDGDYRTLATMQGSYSMETNSSVNRDPLFTNAASDDFTLASNSSERTAGTQITANNSEFSVTVQGETHTFSRADLLDPRTDWTQFPSETSIMTINVNDDGVAGWPRGGYAPEPPSDAPIEGFRGTSFN